MLIFLAAWVMVSTACRRGAGSNSPVSHPMGGFGRAVCAPSNVGNRRCILTYSLVVLWIVTVLPMQMASHQLVEHMCVSYHMFVLYIQVCMYMQPSRSVPAKRQRRASLEAIGQVIQTWWPVQMCSKLETVGRLTQDASEY